MAQPGDSVFILLDGLPVETVIDEKGVQRFHQNDIVRHLVDTNVVDLNKLYIEVLTQKLDELDYIEFYMGLGYSVSGFYECFGPGSSWEDNGKRPLEIINPLWMDPETVH